MNIRLRVMEGPREGDEFLIKDDIIIGRNSGDLQLRDNKVSSQHAKITVDSDGGYVLEDLNSSNGTFLNDTKIEKSAIKDGDIIKIGRTILNVEEAEAKTFSDPAIEKDSWQGQINLALAGALAVAEMTQKESPKTKAFASPVKLEIVQGLQLGVSAVFGFGPRMIGGMARDFILTEEGVPEKAFELMPDPSGACLVVPRCDALKLNGTLLLEAQKIKTGDRLSIGNTVISFIEVL